MTLNSRLDRVERSLRPDDSRVVFHRCEQHDDLPWAEHVELHRQRGEFLFTLDLGAADIRWAADAA
jgi:hypothetical protein